jgi:catechol 2,3-dioxygenase-like lactoylglutathione lyase family enzyme
VVEVLGELAFTPAIPAKDLDGTRRFYEDVLGLSVEEERPDGITYRSGDTSVVLYPTQFAGTAQHTLGGWTVPDIRSAMTELRSRGVVFEEYDFPGLKTEDGVADLGGEWSAWFMDPEGNILGLFQPK